MLNSALERLGTHVLRFLDQAGDFAVVSGRACRAIFRRPFDGASLIVQFQARGVRPRGRLAGGGGGRASAPDLGNMQVTEQFDALECLATDPIHYLFVPRLLASAIMLPLLVGLSIYVGYWGGYLLLVGVEGQSAVVYATDFYKLLAFRDLRIALYKAFVFGLIIALVGCWRGYRARGGAEGVGNAPTSSVVTSSLWILIADFFLTKLLLV